METHELNPGDRCPNCGGGFVPTRRLNDDEYRRIYDRENPEPVPPFTDTMRPDLVLEHGALHRCERCGYRTRFPVGDTDRPARSKGSRDVDDKGRHADQGRDQSEMRRELEASRRRIAELERQVQGSGGSASA